MSPVFSYTVPHQHEVALWQFANGQFAVTYGAEHGKRTDYATAAEQLGGALMHALACNGDIDTPEFK